MTITQVERHRATALPLKRPQTSRTPSSRRAGIAVTPKVALDPGLGRSALPVVEELAVDLGPTPIGVLLANHVTEVVVRRAGPPEEEGRLDRLRIVPGSSLDRRHAGTNGLGEAAATGVPSLVVGNDHSLERLSGTATAGAPIRDPRTSRVVGVLGLVCPLKEVNALMVPVAVRAARSIERRLTNHPSSLSSRLTANLSRSRRWSSDDAAVRGARPTFGWSSLTQTETAVCDLVADGLTNREVGKLLHLSPHTVDSHLRHIFCKLGIRSRVTLARMVSSRAS